MTITDRSWMGNLRRFPPLLSLFRDWLVGLIVAAVMVGAITTAFLEAPYFGLRLSLPADDGPPRLQRVYDTGPAAIAGAVEGSQVWLFSAADVVINPQKLRDLRQEARLYEPATQAENTARAAAFAKALERTGELRLVQPDEREVFVAGRAYSIADLRISYWLVAALLCLINAFAFVSARHADTRYTTVLFLTFGLSATVGGLLYLVHSEAEIVLLAFDPVRSIRANHGLAVVFAAATLLLFAAKPAQIVPKWAGWAILSASAGFAFLLTATGVPVSPLVASALLMGAAVALLVIGTAQFLRARRRATDRVMVHVVLLCLIAGLSLAMMVAVYSGAVLVDGSGSADLMSYFVVLLVAIGLFLITAPIDLRRSRHLGQQAVNGLVASLFILAADSFLISTFALGRETAMVLIGLSLVVLFQPVRMLINRIVLRRTDAGRDRLVTRLMTEGDLLAEGSNATEEFAEFLAEFFSASSVEVVRNMNAERAVAGTQLEIARLRAGEADYRIVGKSMGTRLFSVADQALVEEAGRVVQALLGLQQEAQTAEVKERDRIARELHDLVGNKLLSLKITSKDPDVRLRAGDALSSLQDAVMGLDGGTESQTDQLSIFQSTFVDAFPAGWNPVFKWSGDLGRSSVVDPRRLQAFQRILQESASNAVKYGVPGSVTARIEQTADRLHLKVHNEISPTGSDTDTGGTGKGLENISHRAAAFGGTARWQEDEGQFMLDVELPIGKIAD